MYNDSYLGPYIDHPTQHSPMSSQALATENLTGPCPPCAFVRAPGSTAGHKAMQPAATETAESRRNYVH